MITSKSISGTKWKSVHTLQGTVDMISKIASNDVPSQRIAEISLAKGFHNPKSLVKGNPKA